ncbi:hypothetical protein DPX16_5329 [Anabarilius grahami]|uniref:Uncharacterized protein n=1 Tax=Anabarilius grahami TaxID=495550 RepID=A0A3N0Y2W4_ANAGA|nr:hypothetical protein DPX16_5329 [Anabarilius grahami]
MTARHGRAAYRRRAPGRSSRRRLKRLLQRTQLNSPVGASADALGDCRPQRRLRVAASRSPLPAAFSACLLPPSGAPSESFPAVSLPLYERTLLSGPTALKELLAALAALKEPPNRRYHGGGVAANAAPLCPPAAVGWKTKRALPSKPCRTTSTLAGRAYTSAGQAASALHTMAIFQVFQAKLLRSLDESGADEPAFRDLRSATDLALRATKATAQAIGRSMASLVSYDLMSYGESPAYIVTCPAHFGGKIRALFAYRLRGRAAPSLVQRLVYE